MPTMKYNVLIGDDGERREVVVEYSDITALVRDILDVGRIHSPTARTSERDRVESASGLPLLKALTDWRPGDSVTILNAEEAPLRSREFFDVAFTG